MSRSASAADSSIPDAESDRLFADFVGTPALVLAVSGGPDSTALLLLASHWRERQSPLTRLVAVTIDHGLRPEARREAIAVKRLAAALGVSHRTRRWIGAKPTTGIQESARSARYRLLYVAARSEGAAFVLTAHTLDDQAETVLLRFLRGSGVSGMGGMARQVRLCEVLGTTPTAARVARTRSIGAEGAVAATSSNAAPDVWLVRPLLGVTKARLIATLREAEVTYAEDPSNRDPRFTRARLRKLMPLLAAEGVTAERLERLARRLKRAEAALEVATDQAAKRIGSGNDPRRVVMPWQVFAELPDEIALRLLGRAIDRLGNEGPVELGKLETLYDAVAEALRTKALGCGVRFRRTLAGAMVSLQRDDIVVETAPPRRRPSGEPATARR